MIIDIHTHIFPKDFRGQREMFFSSEPAFKLLYESPKSKMAGTEDIIRTMDEEGVDRSVVFGFPWRSADTFKRHNDYIMEAVQKYPHRLIGLGCFDPDNPEAAPETERCLAGGLSGVGELAFYQSGVDDAILDKLAPIMALCVGKTVMIHTNEPVGHLYPGKTPITPGQIYRLARRFPENTIILAHWGGGIFFYHMMKRDVKETLQNIYYDTAASPFLYDPAIYSVACRIVGPEKILFGSDYPLLKPSRYFREIEATDIGKENIEAICGMNAKKLIGL